MPETVQHAGILRFPLEIMAAIFSHLDTPDKGRTAQVCVAWRDASYCHSVWRGAEAFLHQTEPDISLLSSLTKRDIRRVHMVDLRWLPHVIDALPNLQHLSLKGCEGVTDLTLNVLFQCDRPMLTKLNLCGCLAITLASVMLVVQRFPNLELLDVSCCFNVGDEELALVGTGLRKLTRLNLSGCRLITNTVLWNMIEDNPRLEVLGLKACNGLGNSSVSLLCAGLHFLHSLDLSYSTGIKDIALKFLSQHTGLRRLNLTHCKGITYLGFRYLLRMGPSRLTDLILSMCDGVNDQGVRYLAKLTDLRRLDVSLCAGVGDKSMEYLARYGSRIETLKLGPLCTITDKGMMEVGKMLNLRQLDMSGCDYVNSRWLNTLCWSKFPLTHLNIRGCDSLDSQSLFRIALSRHTLHTLSLDERHVDDKGLTMTPRFMTSLKKLMCGNRYLIGSCTSSI